MSCPKHPRTTQHAEYEPNCGCCGDGSFIRWVCPKCEKLKKQAYERELRKTAHWCADARGVTLQYLRFAHGGKPMRKGQLVMIDTKTGYIVPATKEKAQYKIVK